MVGNRTTMGWSSCQLLQQDGLLGDYSALESTLHLKHDCPGVVVKVLLIAMVIRIGKLCCPMDQPIHLLMVFEGDAEFILSIPGGSIGYFAMPSLRNTAP